MHVIYKYKLESNVDIYPGHAESKSKEVTELNLPVSATVRYIGMQNDDIYAWIQVDKDCKQFKTFKIYKIGTGHEIPGNAPNYLGSIQQYGFVWHFYM